MAPLAIDMYVPGFPELGRTLHAPDSAVQLTMTAFLAGLVVGQLVIGPLSDALGRRARCWPGRPCSPCSPWCAPAPRTSPCSWGASPPGCRRGGGTVLARAMVADTFHGPELSRHFSLLSTMLAAVAVAAPVLGGAVLSLFGWRAVFVVLSAAARC
ncbi:MFS transporter [Streptomyces sp. M19]